MNNISVVTMITGGGWECDTVGYFKRESDAVKAVEALLKNDIWGASYLPARIEFHVKRPYYLRYIIKSEEMEVIK